MPRHVAGPESGRDRRSFTAISAFIAALFAEMRGFALVIYLLSGWLESRYSNIDFTDHGAGHLLEVMFRLGRAAARWADELDALGRARHVWRPPPMATTLRPRTRR